VNQSLSESDFRNGKSNSLLLAVRPMSAYLSATATKKQALFLQGDRFYP